MSKIIYVCFRNEYLKLSLKDDIATIAKNITPDNFTPAPPKNVELNGIIYGIPTILAAPNDLKFPYVEIINPLLSHKIVKSIYQLPTQFRSKKVLFKKIVKTLSPDIEFATEGANAEKRNILKASHVVELLTSELKSEVAKSLFLKAFLEYLLENIKTSDNTAATKRKKNKSLAHDLVPSWLLKNSSKLGIPKSNVDVNLLAFRVFIVWRMNKLFMGDCKTSQSKADFELSA